MKKLAFLSWILLVAACGDDGVDEHVLDPLMHATCESAYELELETGRRERVETNTTGLEPTMESCPFGDVATFVSMPHAVGEISYYANTPTYYFVSECTGEPTSLAWAESESGAPLLVSVRGHTKTRKFEDEHIIFMRCQPPDTIRYLEMWIGDETGWER